MSECMRKTFNTRLTTVMETLLRAAVFEITRIFESTLLDSQLELSRSRNEIDTLKRRLEASEKHTRSLGEAGVVKRVGRTLGSIRSAPASCAVREPAAPQPGAGLTGKRPPLAGNANTPGEVTLQDGSKQPKRIKDEGPGVESSQVQDPHAEVVSVIIKEEVVEQDSDPVVVKSSPGLQVVKAPSPSVGNISEGSQQESHRGVQLKLQPTENPAISSCLSPHGMPCIPQRPGPCSQGCGQEDFNSLASAQRKEGCAEMPPDMAREHGDVGDTPPCRIRTCRVSSIQQRCLATETQKLIPSSGSAGFGPFQPCLLSVREIPEVNRTVDSIQAQYVLKQGKLTASSQPQRHLANSNPGERPYSCTLCLKGFISPSHLNMHMRVHTGERPYCCSQCGMRFAQKGNLRAHQRQVHQGKRPFPCPECGKCFTKRGNLRTHQQQVHLGKRPFPCTECGKGYFSQKDLKVHQRVHGGE